ncbi:lipid transport family protein [Planoprotostelium fungivorum]|uniref:Lipid transport family protein n=1 Tax=Planoprotostelium fungivorum TaxID=1890364 RepID=A0A2P6NI05_9EUKA|nr:lipid transport family protein [Planoprotostelium fungivorum]
MRLHQGHSGPNQGPTNLKPPRNEEEKGTEEEKREGQSSLQLTQIDVRYVRRDYSMHEPSERFLRYRGAVYQTVVVPVHPLNELRSGEERVWSIKSAKTVQFGQTAQRSMKMEAALKLCFLLLFVSSVSSTLRYDRGLTMVYDVVGTLTSKGSSYLSDLETNSTQSTFTAQFTTECLFSTKEYATFYAYVSRATVSNDVSTQKLYGLFSKQLGHAFYYNQTFQGRVTSVQLDTRDNAQYQQIKLGVINALNTRILSPLSTELVEDFDVIGRHRSHMSAASKTAEDMLPIKKEFSQTDVVQYSDPEPHTIQMQALGHAMIHSKGYIHSASLQQKISMTQGNQNNGNGQAAADMSPTCLGHLNLTLNDITYDSLINNKRAERETSTTTSEYSVCLLELTTSAHYDSLKEAATSIILKLATERAESHDTESALARFFSAESLSTPLAHEIARVLTQVPAKMKLMTSRLEDVRHTVRALYLLSLVREQSTASKFFVHYGLKSEHRHVREQAVSMSHHVESPSEEMLHHLSSIRSKDSALAYVSVATRLNLRAPYVRQLLPQRYTGASVMDYNISRSANYSLGGSWVGAGVEGSISFRSQDKCTNKEGFDFDFDATADLYLEMFMQKQNALKATASYGNHAHPKAIDFEVWGKVVKHVSLPDIDCTSHVYNWTSYHPGFSFSYNLWTAVIPVTFSAVASLRLDIAYGYEVCPLDLKAKVDVIPDASVIVSAEMMVDLLLVKSGTKLAGQLSTVVQPEVSIDTCEATATVTRKDRPMDLSFDVYYQWRRCKILWIFDCVMDEMHEPEQWKWSLPASEHVLAKWNLLTL